MEITKETLDSLNSLSLKNDVVALQRFQQEDIEFEIAQDSNPVIMKYVRDILEPDEVIARAKSIADPWQGKEDEWLGLTIRSITDDQMMGMLSFKLTSLEYGIAEIGYRIHPDFQNQGLVTAATRLLLDYLFKVLKLHKVMATCVPENIPSWKVMEKLGFQREGEFRKHSKIGGEWFNELFYGLLAEEYLSP